jgi:phospholipase/carboxylesterase
MAPMALHAWSSDRPEDVPGRPLLVLLHGRGADERSLALLADDAPPGVPVTALRAPNPEGLGWSWFHMHAIGYPVRASLVATRERVLAWLDDTWQDADGVAVLGFSDGALLAADLLLAAPERFEAAVLLGGAVAWSAAPPVADGRLAGLRVLHSYGDADPVVPQELLQRTQSWLVDRSGAQVEVHVQPGLVHAVSTEQVQRARRFLAAWAAERS